MVVSAKAAVVTSKTLKLYQVVSDVPRHFPTDPETQSGKLGRGVHATVLIIAGLGCAGKSDISSVKSTML